MKFMVLAVLLGCLSACGTINTPHDGLDAIYNTTSAIVHSKDNAVNCKHGHPDDRKRCQEQKQSQTDAISRAIKKHQKVKKAQQL